VKITLPIFLVLIPLLFACAPKITEIPMAAAPARPLIEALERHRQAFEGLKAVASVEVVKGIRRRSFDTVGVVVDAQRRLRMEAYGPLGQTVMAIVWDGREVLLRMPGEDKVKRPGPAGLERLLGQGVEPSKLCELLSGNVPDTAGSDATLLCRQDGGCVLELRQGKVLRRARTASSSAGSAQEPQVVSYEFYRAGKLMFEARFDRVEEISRYRLPMRIVIENPERNLRMTIHYTEAEVNTPIGDDAFSLTDEPAAADR
jgi:outer membrane lipoprotein-sorting protein